MPPRPYVIGLTGNIACGKSTVGRILARLGARVIDADQLVHALMEPGTPETQQIAARFGPGVLDREGRVDRRALGRLVWGNPEALRDLERILHPRVLEAIRHCLATTSSRVVVVDAVRLIESGLWRDADTLWVVTAPRSEQIRRLVRDRGLDEADAVLRIEAQPPQEEKTALADVVLDNSGSVDDLERQVLAAWERIPEQYRQPVPPDSSE